MVLRRTTKSFKEPFKDHYFSVCRNLSTFFGFSLQSSPLTLAGQEISQHDMSHSFLLPEIGTNNTSSAPIGGWDLLAFRETSVQNVLLLSGTSAVLFIRVGFEALKISALWECQRYLVRGAIEVWQREARVHFQGDWERDGDSDKRRLKRGPLSLRHAVFLLHCHYDNCLWMDHSCSPRCWLVHCIAGSRPGRLHPPVH